MLASESSDVRVIRSPEPNLQLFDAQSMRIQVEEVRIIPNCTIAFGYGLNDTGEAVTFAGDRRMMQDLAKRIARTESPVSAEVVNWQLWAVGDE